MCAHFGSASETLFQLPQKPVLPNHSTPHIAMSPSVHVSLYQIEFPDTSRTSLCIFVIPSCLGQKRLPSERLGWNVLQLRVKSDLIIYFWPKIPLKVMDRVISTASFSLTTFSSNFLGHPTVCLLWNMFRLNKNIITTCINWWNLLILKIHY